MTTALTAPAQRALDFDEIYTNGYPVTVRRAAQVLGALAAQDSGLAEVVAQEAWVRVWQHWPDELECRHDRAVYAWALQAAQTIAIDVQRRVATLARLGQIGMTDHLWDAGLVVWADPAADRQPEAQTLYRALVDDLRAVARTLPGAPDARHTTHGRDAALFEALLAGEEQPATARRLGLGESAVKMSAWRLRHRLRAHLRRADEADADDDDEADEADAV